MRFITIFSVLAFVFVLTALVMAVIVFIPAGIAWLILTALNIKVSFWLIWGITTLIGLIIKA